MCLSRHRHSLPWKIRSKEYPGVPFPNIVHEQETKLKKHVSTPSVEKKPDIRKWPGRDQQIRTWGSLEICMYVVFLVYSSCTIVLVVVPSFALTRLRCSFERTTCREPTWLSPLVLWISYIYVRIDPMWTRSPETGLHKHMRSKWLASTPSCMYLLFRPPVRLYVCGASIRCLAWFCTSWSVRSAPTPGCQERSWRDTGREQPSSGSLCCWPFSYVSPSREEQCRQLAVSVSHNMRRVVENSEMVLRMY